MGTLAAILKRVLDDTGARKALGLRTAMGRRARGVGAKKAFVCVARVANIPSENVAWRLIGAMLRRMSM